MLRGLLVVLVLLTACGSASPTQFPDSPCEIRSFEGSRFTVCSVSHGRVEVMSGSGAAPARTFADLEKSLGVGAANVAFAMNAGMFDEQGRAIGLLVENGKQLHAINLHRGGGNFGLLPNGVFLVRASGTAEVVTGDRYRPSPDIRFATQSGPMLVIDGKLHPKFDPDGESRNIRNGVGIAPNGTPMFVISNDSVSFGKLARFFRDDLKAQNALYFDGAVSSLWDPADERRDMHDQLGPMVVVFKGEASKAGP
jgi:uncharacterized protein YigE (DUF2233 family)